MADQDLNGFAETTAIEDTDIIAVYKKSSDSIWRWITGANLRGTVVLDEDNLSTDSTTKAPSQQSIAQYIADQFPGALTGLGLSNGTDSDHDINIETGQATLQGGSSNNKQFVLPSVLTKQIDANWAEGSAAGGFPSGLTLSSDTTYHIFVIGKDDGTVDAGFDTSLTASNLLADASTYSWFRRIGSIYTDGSSNIVSFSQDGDEFLIDPVNDYNAANPGTSAVLRSLSVPTGIQVGALHTMNIFDDTGGGNVALYGLLTSPGVADTAPSSTIYDMEASIGGSDNDAAASIYKQVRTDTSGQVRTRVDRSDADVSVIGITYGWIDARGQ